MRKILQHIFMLSAVVLSSCTGRNSAGQHVEGDSIEMRHARNISIVKHSGYTLVRLSDPWNKDKVLHTYILIRYGESMPKDLPEGTVIRTPLRNTVVSTSVHCSLLMSLGRAESIHGVCDLQYINIPGIKEAAGKGTVADCGSSMAPSIEKIIELHPDAILLSPFQNSGGYGKLEKLRIPIIEAADYMEPTALGRAEWIKFYGMLWGAEEKADSIFRAVEAEYLELKALAGKSKVRKSVMMDTKTGSVWYMPGGRSTIGQLIKDAGMAYPFADDDNSGSLPLSFETVLERAADTDIWMLRYGSDTPLTLSGLRAEYGGYGQFRAFKTGEVYGCNTLTSSFYEDTPFHPERLLRDFVMIAHPDLGIKGTAVYFQKLK